MDPKDFTLLTVPVEPFGHKQQTNIHELIGHANVCKSDFNINIISEKLFQIWNWVSLSIRKTLQTDNQITIFL